MTKKIGLGLVALIAVTASVVGLSAFEAHVINVTAKIENALAVNTEAINFGTVFPQEELEKTLALRLSDSFRAEDRVDDVEYIIRQKPKCAVTSDNGTVLVGPTWTGHVNSNGTIDCETDKPENLPNPLPTDQTAGLLPSLCEYISKHPDRNPQPGNDGSLNSFHKPYTVDPITGVITWNDTKGRLAKSELDFDDLWTIDLKVPCFGDHCAQDWIDFVHGINPDANPDDYVQPMTNEHKIFGCDLWIEVKNISEEQRERQTNFLVKPYLVYPADKPTYPAYEASVEEYMQELQSWYGEKVGETFRMAPLQVVRSSHDYVTMRCGENPTQACIDDPSKLEGNWPAFMNKAIHNGNEEWEQDTAALVFGVGGGGFAGGTLYPNNTGWAVVGDWMLEPLSGIANEWGIPCQYSHGWECVGGVPKGTPTHELGHAFGLPHPDGYAGDSIMKWHGDYPVVGFLPHEIEYLLESPFFESI